MAVALLVLLIVPERLGALSLSELLDDPGMTPKRFAGLFEDFEYLYGVEILAPEVFLRRRRGDCDDHAVLADYVLRQKGYGTRLVHVRMVGRVAHEVCYVTESGAYIDYNDRRYFLNLQRCGRSIRQIAAKVAASFAGNWTSASEFTYNQQERRKHFSVTVVKTDPPSSDPDSAPGRG
jgi:hypothetical protein